MPQFVLMLRDNGFPTDWTADQIEACIGRYQQWMQQARATGEKLRDNEGRVVVRKEGGLTVTDGPFAEGREVIGGYMIIEADSYEQAVERCHDSPHLEVGSIEVRQIEVL
ncbi:MAG TPA: YciI family protein [Thermoanaerobaculia bacterium]